MRQNVGGGVRDHNLVAKLKIAKFFSAAFARESFPLEAKIYSRTDIFSDRRLQRS